MVTVPDVKQRVQRVAMTCVAVACAVGLLSAGVARAAAQPSAVQQGLDRVVADGVPGAIALVRDGGQSERFAAGVSNLQTGQPIRASDRFRIGSITKAFASTVALQLVGERRLSLDDSVERWLPGLVPNGASITVRELMNHTSGVPDYIDAPFYLQVLKDPLRFHTPRELVRLAVAKPPTSEPGTAFEYSNTDYILLGLIVAAVDRVATQPWLQIAAPALEVQRRVIQPLRLRDTSFPLVDPDIRGPHTHGYVIDPPPEWGLPPILDTTRTSPSFAWTAGAIIGTLDDVADFHRALFAGGLLRADEQRELETTVAVAPGLDYGLGVFKLQTPCGPAWGHDGGTTSSVVISLTSPDQSRQAVVMVNRDANSWTPQIATDYTSTFLSAFCGEGVSTPTAQPLARKLLASLQRVG